jgi:hypothetical protein
MLTFRASPYISAVFGSAFPLERLLTRKLTQKNLYFSDFFELRESVEKVYYTMARTKLLQEIENDKKTRLSMIVPY